MSRIFPIFAAAGLCLTAWGPPPEERFDHKVRGYFFAGFAGDREALERGMKITESVLAREPKHAEAMVWHGAGVYFQAGQAFGSGDSKKGIELAMRGLGEMDQAVALAPADVGVRIPRGASLLAATRFIADPKITRPLLERAVSDYEKAMEVQKAGFAKMGVHPRGELLLGLGDGWSRLGEQEKAQKYFERLAGELPGTPYAASAKTWLETKTLSPRQAGCLGCHVP